MGFLDFLTGGRQAKDLQNAYNDSSRSIDAGEVKARGDITGGRDRANAMLQPYMDSASRSTKLRDDMLGINGPEAQAAAYAQFQNDPGFQSEVDAGIGALDRSATARGGLYSGNAIKGVARYGQEMQHKAYGDRINQLSGAVGQGQGMVGAAAGMEFDTGKTLGDLSWGAAGTRASNRINIGNAMAATRNIGPQNALNAFGSFAKLNPFGWGQKK